MLKGRPTRIFGPKEISRVDYSSLAGGTSIDGAVGARLLRFKEAWSRAPRLIRSIINSGLQLKWAGKAPSTRLPPLSSPPTHAALTPLVEKFHSQGAITNVPLQKCFRSHIFAVPKANGEFRMILNLSRLNKFITTPVFKLPNHNTLRKIIPQRCWLAKLDLTDAYLHIPIARGHQKFLAFTFQKKLFFFRALPFGLSSAPYVFTRVLQYPLQLLRQKEVNTIAYLDDLIFWGRSKWEVRRALRIAKKIFTRLGFLLNLRKSVIRPSQGMVWLGFFWNMKNFSWSLPRCSQRRLRQEVAKILGAHSVSRRQLEKLQGLMAFAAQVLPLGKFHAHSLPKFIKMMEARRRDHLSLVSPRLRTEIRWWMIRENLSREAPIRDAPPTVQIFTDASNFGFGALDCSGRYIQGSWSEVHTGLHINCKELLASALALESELAPRNASVALFTDNKTTYYAIKNKGSNKSPVIQEFAGRVLRVLMSKNISMYPVYLPGSRNVSADALSRDTAIPTEWSLSHQCFRDLIAKIGWTPEVDLMATPGNTKLHRYVAPFQVKGAAGTDFFAMNLTRWRKIYIFPPHGLLLKTLARVLRFEGKVLLIAPWLPTQPWFPMLKGRATQCLRLAEPPFQIVQGEKIVMPSIRSSRLRAWVL